MNISISKLPRGLTLINYWIRLRDCRPNRAQILKSKNSVQVIFGPYVVSVSLSLWFLSIVFSCLYNFYRHFTALFLLLWIPHTCSTLFNMYSDIMLYYKAVVFTYNNIQSEFFEIIIVNKWLTTFIQTCVKVSSVNEMSSSTMKIFLASVNELAWL